MEELCFVFVLAESDNGVTGKTDKPVLGFVSCLIWGLKAIVCMLFPEGIEPVACAEVLMAVHTGLCLCTSLFGLLHIQVEVDHLYEEGVPKPVLIMYSKDTTCFSLLQECFITHTCSGTHWGGVWGWGVEGALAF